MTKIIGIANTCKECPNRHYFSGGTYECLVTRQALNGDSSIPVWCPLADHPSSAIEALTQENTRLRLEFRADCEKQAEELFAVQRDAARWRAFINCARIRLFGWAGYGSTKGGQVREPDSNGYRHFGGEFWTIYDASSDPMAQEILTGFADAAVAIDAARSQSEEKS